MTDELKRLLKQKKEIEERIKEMKAEFFIRTDRVRFETKKDNAGKKIWQISILDEYTKYDWNRHLIRYEENTAHKAERWLPIARMYTKEEAIAKMSRIISDLTEFKQIIEEGKDEQI